MPPRKSPQIATEGHRQLFSLRSLSGVTIAAAARVTPQAVSSWRLTGDRPDPSTRELLLRAYGIAPGDWDLAPRREGDRVRPDAVPSAHRINIDSNPLHVIREIELPDGLPEDDAAAAALDPGWRDELIREIRSIAPELPARERMRALEVVGRMMAAAERAHAERELTMERWLATPEWQEAVRVLAQAMAPYPEALAALQRALGGMR